LLINKVNQIINKFFVNVIYLNLCLECLEFIEDERSHISDTIAPYRHNSISACYSAL
jgi:hypothetical protein